MPGCLRFLILFLLLYGCTSDRTEEQRRSVFNYNELNGLSSLDPAAASNFENMAPVNQLFNGLVEMNDSLRVCPSIAKTYTVSQDGKEYLFHLRDDVYFHDDACFKDGKGRKVRARDFEYSFDRLRDSRVSSATTLLGNVEPVMGFQALNDTVFRIRLRKPFNAFLSILTMKFFSVIPREAIDAYGLEFRSHPVGTGPFKFKSWHEGNKLIMVKNVNYFEKDEKGQRLPYLDAVTVSFMRDRETAFMELLNGKFDMLSGADAFNTNEVLDREGNLRDLYSKKFALQKATYLKTDYIGIMVDEKSDAVKHSPLRFQKVRQAINYGFDRSKMVRYLRNNIGVPAHAGFIPPGLPSFDSTKVKGYYYAPEKAARLLAEAGFPGGKGLPVFTLHITETYKEQVEFIQSQLAVNNIRTEISVEKTSVLRQAVNRGEYLLFKKSWLADYADEENFMSLFYSKNFSPEGVNFFHYRNPEFDRLFEAALTEKDAERKKDLFQRMDQIVTTDAPVINLYYDEVVRLVSHEIQNLNTNPMNLLQLKRVRKTTGP